MATRKRKKIVPSSDPQNIGDKNAWYYESRRGIQVVVQYHHPISGEFISGAVVNVPWGRLMRSAARCGWKVQRVR